MQKIFVISGLALASGCGTAPKVSPCLVRTASGGCFYAPQGSSDVQLRPFDATDGGMDKNICFTPLEHQMIVEWIKRHGGKPASTDVLFYEASLNKIKEKIDGINHTEQGL